MARPLARFVVLSTTLLLPPAAAGAQCKECGVRTAEQRDKKSEPDRRHELPRPGPPGMTPGSARGAQLDLRHGATARSLLHLPWTYPQVAGSGTLTRTEALARINGGNQRKPLLVLRTCSTCGSCTHPLLERSDDDETRLLCRWFHLVKLPAAAARPGHPLSSLFAEDGEHAFACHWTGAERVEFGHRTSRGQFHQALRELISQANQRKPAPAVSGLLALLGKLDRVDETQLEGERQFERESVKTRPSRGKIAKLRALIDKARAEREDLLTRAARLLDLGALPAPRVRR